MGGFGGGPFGYGGFGEWPWSLFTIIEGVPSVYREQDEDAGQGTMRALLEAVVPSMDDLRRKVRDFDDLRDPLLAPIEQSFLVPQTILKSIDLGDGYSRVFLSEGPDGDKFDGLRPGMVLYDFRGFRFIIDSVQRAGQAFEYSDAPIDPVTGEATGKNVVVANVGQSRTTFIPFVSGTFVSRENPAVEPATGSIVAVAQANLNDGETFTLDDGVNPLVTFEFDLVPDGVTPGNIAIPAATLTTDIQVADAMVVAINGADNLNLVANNGNGVTATVTIENVGTGNEGNIGNITPWSHTVIDAGFVITQPTGGARGAYGIEDGITLVDDGVRGPPYVFSVEGSYIDGLDIAENRITIEWTEGGELKTGSFTNEGRPGGDLADTSVINTSADGAIVGQIRLFNDGGGPIDGNSILVTYTKADSPPPEDAEVRAQNILAFLANDVGITLDRNDPEVLQRSYVNSAWKIWNVKGTELGYDVLGQYAGYFVSASPLYAITGSIALGLPPEFVFEFPAGTAAVGSITAIAKALLLDGETFTLDDGINTPITFEFDIVPDGITPGNVLVDISADTSATEVATRMVAAINAQGSFNLNATNEGGTSQVVTISNQETGAFGNEVTWFKTVINGGFIIAQPTGGTDGQLFTTIAPGRPKFDEVILDVIPLDLLCSDETYPTEAQTVEVVSVTLVREEGTNKRNEVVVSTSEMHLSFGTEGELQDFSGATFGIENFERIDSTSYKFEVSNFVEPVTGAGTVTWNVFKFEPPNFVAVTSTFAAGSISTVAAAGYSDGQSFTLIDTAGGVEQFEFDVTGDGVAANARAVNIASATTADEVRNAIISAVNGADDVAITASSGGAALVVLTQDVGGNKGNREIIVSGPPPGTFTDFSGGTGNVTDLGRQSVGFTGRRYRITDNFTDPPIAGTGSWAFIDSDGVISYIEDFAPTGVGDEYEWSIVSGTPPATGTANIFLQCEVVTDCDFCRASSIFVRISPTTILNFPEALEGDSLGRLIIRLQNMIPAHVRIAAFVFDPGPAIATWGDITAFSTTSNYVTDDALWTAFYDEDEFPADEIPADSAPILASSTIETDPEQATGTLTFGNTLIVDGETFVLDDGVNPAVTFEFDDDASVIESGILRRVDVSAASTVDDYKNAALSAINGAPTLDITASDGGTGVVDLINDTAGGFGVVPIVETVVDPGFVADGMNGKLWGEWFNENVLEEYVDGSDPIVGGTWTATGLWHVTEYRSCTQYRSFNYGQNDVGREGEVGSNPPDYDGIPDTTVHRLTSPTFSLGSTDTVTIRFKHFGDLRSGTLDDAVRVELYRTGPTLMKTITKTDLGLAGTGTNGSFTIYTENISADVTVSDTYWLEFVYDEGSGAAGGSGAGTGEGWYVDDIEVQVTPP